VAAPPLAGHFSVERSARLIRHYRYATERMMRILGGWIALTPELSAKLLMGRHVWDSAQHADAFGRRLPELRARAQESEPASAAFVDFMDVLEAPEEPHLTVERLVGVYRVLKPHLLATYAEHLERANPVYEPPTRRILERCVEDERRHIAAGEALLRHLASTEDHLERAVRWRARLEEALAAAGGVTGEGCPAPGPDGALPAGDPDVAEFIRLDALEPRWVMPPDLGAALDTFAKALERGDRAAADAWLVPGLSLPQALQAALGASRWHGHCLTACARVGAHRAVKLRLGGPDTTITLLARWVCQGTGWRVAALEALQIGRDRSA
jgi:hypothetical protein